MGQGFEKGLAEWFWSGGGGGDSCNFLVAAAAMVRTEAMGAGPASLFPVVDSGSLHVVSLYG